MRSSSEGLGCSTFSRKDICFLWWLFAFVFDCTGLTTLRPKQTTQRFSPLPPLNKAKVHFNSQPSSFHRRFSYPSSLRHAAAPPSHRMSSLQQSLLNDKTLLARASYLNTILLWVIFHVREQFRYIIGKCFGLRSR